MSASTSQFASMMELRARFSVSLLAAALFAPLCQLSTSGQNAATTVNVDAGTINVNSLPDGAIDPRIYGIGMIGSDCEADTANLTALNSPTHRWGGDLTSTYNWQTDSWNLSNDWYWELFTIGSGNGACVDQFITNTRASGVGTEPIITVPMLPWISNSSSAAKYQWSFPISVYGAQTGADYQWRPDAGNGVLASTGKNIVNNPSDDYVPNSAAIQKAWVQHLVTTFGGSTASTGVKYYMLDNEPDIWDGTHRDAHPNYPNYDEMWADIQAYAGAIKQADPSAIVIGPEEAMWAWMWVSEKDMKDGTGAGSDYATHGNMYFYPWLLKQLAAYKQANGVSLIDILSVHCYDDLSSNPNQATRVLWDDTYTDAGGWFNVVGGGVVDYIPTMRNWVKAAFPNGDGPLVGCTEYHDFGGSDASSISGATTEADVLGIFGAYGFSLGNFWTLPAKPAYFAMQIYRNYDGKNSTFGDTSVTDTVVQPDNLSSFAAVRKSDGALTVMVINKQTGTTPVTINLTNFSNGGEAKAYQISSASQTSINSLGSKTITNNKISDTLPGPSVTLYVIPAVTVAPTAPTNLTAAGGNGLVTLNWTGVTGAASYNIYRGTTAGGENTTPIATNVTAVTYVDSTVTNGQIYYYTVKAVNGMGTSGPSNEASATPSASDPLFTATATASPNPATQNASTTLTVKVTCTQNSMTGGSVSIVVLDPSGNVAQTTPETSQSFTNGQIQTYSPAITPTVVGTYTVQVNVFSSSGQLFTSIPSAGTFTVNAAGPPAFNITGSVSPATISATGSTNISATFQNNGGTMTNGNIEIQIYPTGGGSTSIGGYAPQYNAWTIAGGTSQTLNFTFTPAAGTAAGTYNVIALAFSNGYGTEYNQATIGTLTIQASAPAAPTGLTATAGNATVGLSWTASSGATSYKVYRGTTSGGESATAIASSISGTTYADSTVTNGTKYYYKVSAVNGGGTGPQSNEASATPEPPVPSAPTGLTATAGNATVGLSWTASSGATSYKVYRGTTSGGESATPIATNVASTTYTDSTVTNGTKYYYKVAAVNGGGTSSMSTEASATPQSPTSTAPNPPTGLAATAGNATVTLRWTAPTGTTGTITYNVFRGTASGGENTTPIISGLTALTYTNTGLANGTTYYYYVEAVSGTASSTPSNEISATPEPPASASFTLSASTPAPVIAGETTTSTITVSTTTGYAGAVSVSCALTSYPSGATDLLVCTSSGSTVTLGSGTSTGATVVNVSSTASTMAAGRSTPDETRRGWVGGGAILALLLFFGIPARRRSWRSMLGILVLIAAFGVISGCSNNLNGAGKNSRGTTAGSYTFTITGTGSPIVTPAPTTTFTLIVN